jgi:putative ABC transport system substrate-binding protein
MKRRDFLLFAGVTAIAWKPATAEITRVGFIHSGSRQENQRLLDAFCENLSALGWTDGHNIAVFDRWAEERTETLPAIMRELIGSGVSVLVTGGTSATLAATRASATLPILVAVDDPISRGVAESLGQPGDNATGLCLKSSEVITERLVLLRELVPGLHRLAVIVRHDPGLDQKLQDIRNDAQQRGSKH